MTIEEGRSPANNPHWLEDEVQQTKAQIAKLQQQAEQLQNQLVRSTEEAQRTQEALTAVRIQVEGQGSLQDQLRQLTNETTILREQQETLRTALDATQHQHETTIEQSRLEWGQLLKRLDSIEKSVTSTEQRANFLEEGHRPLRNDVVAFRQSFAEVNRDLEELQSKNERNLEAGKRVEQTLNRIDSNLDTLARQDENITERLQRHAEHARRLEEQLSSLLDDQTTHDEIFQKMDVVRNEGQYLGERLGSVEKTLDTQRMTLEDQSHNLDLLGPRLQGHADRLTEIHHLVASYHEDLLTHLQRWSQLYEKQRRRQISQLEQELRELKQYEFKLKPE